MAPPWSQNSHFSGNGSFEDMKDETRHIHGMMPVYGDNFAGLRALEVRGQGPFVHHSNLANNGPSILPVPHGYLNGQDTDNIGRTRAAIHMASVSRPPELHSNGFVDDYPHSAYSNPSYGHGGDGAFGQGGNCHGVYVDSEELRDEQSATFAMYRFKVEKCSKQFVHDWKECPYAHEGETARRRHPLSHTAQPCPDFKNSKSCPRGNSCPMAHGPWEAGLHPDAYRTNLCAYGHECKRRMCFFAHDNSELRTTASAGNTQQAQQSGVSSSHGQSGRTTSIVDGNIRGASQISQMGATMESATKRSPAINRGSSISMRGTEPQSFLTPMIREDFGDIAGSFRQHMTLDPEISISDTGFGEEHEVESLHCHPPHMITTPQSLSEYRQVFEVFDRQGHPISPPQPTGSETENEVRFSVPTVGGGVARKRTELKVGATSTFTAAADLEPTLDSGQLLQHDVSFSVSSDNNLPAIAQCSAHASIGSSQSSAGLTQMYPEQIIPCSEPVDEEANPRAGDNSGDKHLGVKRNLQVNIPIPMRSLNPPGVSPTDVMLKQDTSWVDKLLDSPIEAAQQVGGRRVYKFQ
eukprot:CAMPEP_0172166510 /NCGR_PEP_ID=MMETSP1050-20130122/9024_1 /TAXON_ID=233186 /ORGANISM="Cryptomonas curvata, Strain CCAP979/52" /LENGTH=578 /DNA_ID=CAMNT_0012837133 /DNA_START=511 /DNA_END=2247 /DNA_ORIENTATION=-